MTNRKTRISPAGVLVLVLAVSSLVIAFSATVSRPEIPSESFSLLIWIGAALAVIFALICAGVAIGLSRATADDLVRGRGPLVLLYIAEWTLFAMGIILAGLFVLTWVNTRGGFAASTLLILAATLFPIASLSLIAGTLRGTLLSYRAARDELSTVV